MGAALLERRLTTRISAHAWALPMLQNGYSDANGSVTRWSAVDTGSIMRPSVTLTLGTHLRAGRPQLQISNRRMVSLLCKRSTLGFLVLLRRPTQRTPLC